MRESISAIILNDADDVLVLRRAPHKKHFGGSWDALCGKLEPGETPEECLHREVGEEIGVSDISIIRRAEPCIYPCWDGDWLVHLFLCRLSGTSPTSAITLNEEHTSYRWTKLHDLLQEELIPLFRKDLDRLFSQDAATRT
ncbi:NUDIX domain-containing protein [Candidatus Woesearchaeota archaeon]|nr:NUDIX domain-containing protein [Candidatus Woesearchaeota archaeon]